MMRRTVWAAAAALSLAACGQAGAPQLPQVQAGAQAPMVLTGGTAEQAVLSDDERAQLRQLVSSYLNTVQEGFGQGLSPAEGFADEVAGLQPGTDHRWVVNLAGNTAYRILGACDNECSNVDIELIDMSTGGVIASDVLPDDYPVVDFTPAANGSYMVRIIMQTCTIAPCYAGARVLSRGAATANLGKG